MIERYKIVRPSGDPIHLGFEGSTFVVAEIGINHNGSQVLAKELIDLAAKTGCDAVKFQKRDVASFIGGREDDLCESQWGTTVKDKYEGREIEPHHCRNLYNYAYSKGLICFWSFWDTRSIQVFKRLDLYQNLQIIKIPSAKMTDLVYLNNLNKHMSGGNEKVVFLGTGMCTERDVEQAEALLSNARLIVPMQCTSSYPCADKDLHLTNIRCMRENSRDRIAGYSGHETGFYPTLAAIGAGASVVERHITMDNSLEGTDHAMSLDRNALCKMVKAIRSVDEAMGSPIKTVLPCEEESIKRLKLKGN